MRANVSMIDSPAARRCVDRQRLRGWHVANHGAVDELHHVERRPVHVVVGAQPRDGCDRYVGGAQRREDLVLTGHVVRGGEHVAEGRTAQHPPASVRVGDVEGEVGVTAGDERERKRRDRGRYVLAEPGRDLLAVDALDLLIAGHSRSLLVRAGRSNRSLSNVPAHRSGPAPSTVGRPSPARRTGPAEQV